MRNPKHLNPERDRLLSPLPNLARETLVPLSLERINLLAADLISRPRAAFNDSIKTLKKGACHQLVPNSSR
jgi:hypothetical protein